MSKALLALAVFVCAAAAADAAVVRVGPHGTYATFQAGMNAVRLLAGTHEVRVEAGTYREHVVVGECCAGRVEVTGGWNGTFTSRSTATPSVLDGSGSGRVLSLNVARGELSLVSLGIRNGFVDELEGSATGAGIKAYVRGSARLELASLEIQSNRILGATPDFYADGAGVYMLMSERARASVLNCTIRSNVIDEAPEGRIEVAFGGGMRLALHGKAFVELRGNRFVGNGIRASGSLNGGGLAVHGVTAELGATLVDNDFDANRLLALEAGAGTAGAGAYLHFNPVGTEMLVAEARRSRFVANRGADQARVYAWRGGRVEVSDSVAVQGDSHGFRVHGSVPAKVVLNNLTVVENVRAGIRTEGSSVAVYNSLAFGNGTDLDFFDLPDAGFNLEGVDPGFVPGSLYVIGPDSPARDAGTNTPPSGLGTLDVDRGPRVVGGTVDIGADEYKP